MYLLLVLLIVVSALSLFNNYFKIYAFNGIEENTNRDNSFSVLTFNMAAYDSASFIPSKQQGLLELIKQEHPDIVCHQEFSFKSLIKIKPQLDSIYEPCEVLKGDNQMWRLRFYSHLPLRNFSKHKCIGI